MSGQDLFIPPEGVPFRLLAHAGQQVIFARNSPEPQVDLCPLTERHDDQLFTLIYGTGTRKGKYAIKSKGTGNVLFSRTHASPNVGQASGDGIYFDNWFTFEPVEDQHGKLFRLLTPASALAVDIALCWRMDPAPHLWNSNDKPTSEDQYFCFSFDDEGIENIAQGVKSEGDIPLTLRGLAGQVFSVTGQM